MTGEPTGFLYPFLDAEERDASRLMEDLAASARAKMRQSRSLRVDTLQSDEREVRRAAEAMAARTAAGGRVLAFGNGGSATDAEGMVDLFTDPPHGRPLPALSLAEDRAVLTALANDVGVELVFSRQIIAHGRPGDVAVGFSTSGDSANVLRALAEASARGLLTVGLSGHGGGTMARSGTVDHCLVVRSDSVHRIQETQDALVVALWSAIQRCLSTGGPRRHGGRGR